MFGSRELRREEEKKRREKKGIKSLCLVRIFLPKLRGKEKEKKEF